jgi:hypothetical protein
MATVMNARLHDTDGYVVESSEGDVGWVEEVWVGAANEPQALAVRIPDGRRALLLGADILAVDRENRWVVVPAEPTLLELDVPRLTTGDGKGKTVRLAASWTTTGALVPVSASRHRRRRLRFGGSEPAPALAPPSSAETSERPLWEIVAVLYASLALLATFVITLTFMLARAFA